MSKIPKNRVTDYVNGPLMQYSIEGITQKKEYAASIQQMLTSTIKQSTFIIIASSVHMRKKLSKN